MIAVEPLEEKHEKKNKTQQQKATKGPLVSCPGYAARESHETSCHLLLFVQLKTNVGPFPTLTWTTRKTTKLSPLDMHRR